MSTPSATPASAPSATQAPLSLDQQISLANAHIGKSIAYSAGAHKRRICAAFAALQAALERPAP